MLFSFITVLLATLVLSGCSKLTTGPEATSAPVDLSVAFSKSGGGGALQKVFGSAAVDSLRIDSAVVVLQRIKFESHVDSVKVDTTGNDSPESESEINITFRGPFVIHVRDTMAINFANQALPEGTYDGIKFKIHKLKSGESHEDSDDHNNRPRVNNDTSIVGSSIVVWGTIKKNGVWVPFAFKFDGEIEFKIKGSFTVSSTNTVVRIALNFNIGSWFKNPQTGALLDATDTSSGNRELFKQAIYTSFGRGKGGHDRDGDGHPDD